MAGIHPVVGVYTTRAAADRAVGVLRARGIRDQDIVRLSPGDARVAEERVPTTDAEQPDMGKAIGGLLGLSTGLVAATLLVPGVGPVSALGTAAAALLGLGGAVAGAAVGDRFEAALEIGVPHDELLVYEDALRQGRSVIFVLAPDGDDAVGRGVLEETGAETVDAAREQWWLGLRDAEHEHYRAGGERLPLVDSEYRRGFEEALRTAGAGKPVERIAADLRHTPDGASPEEVSFRRGFERGTAYLDAWTRNRRGTRRTTSARPAHRAT